MKSIFFFFKVKSDKSTNGSTIVQTGRFVPTTSVNVSPYHIPKGEKLYSDELFTVLKFFTA